MTVTSDSLVAALSDSLRCRWRSFQGIGHSAPLAMASSTALGMMPGPCMGRLRDLSRDFR